MHFGVWLTAQRRGSPRLSLYGGSIHFISFCVVFRCTDIPLCAHLEMDVCFVHFATRGENARRGVLARVCWCTCTQGGPAESAVVDTAKRFPQALVPADNSCWQLQASWVLSILSRMWRCPFFVLVFFLSVMLGIGWGIYFAFPWRRMVWCAFSRFIGHLESSVACLSGVVPLICRRTVYTQGKSPLWDVCVANTSALWLTFHSWRVLFRFLNEQKFLIIMNSSLWTLFFL